MSKKFLKLILVACLGSFGFCGTKSPFAENNDSDKKQEIKEEVYKPENQNFNTNDDEFDNSMEFLDAIQNSFFVGNRKNTDNNLNINYKRGLTYKIRLRYAMATSFIFENDKVLRYINGDSAGFSIDEIKDDNDNITSLIIKPLKIGIDSNLIVFGKSGQVYTFYIFSTHFTNRRQPLFSVYIKNSDENIKIKKLEELKKQNQILLKNQSQSKTISKREQKIREKQEEMMKVDYSAYEKDEGKFLVIGDTINRLYIEKANIKKDFYQKPKSKRTWWSLWIYKKVSKGSLKIQAIEIFRDKDYTYFKYDRANNQNKFPVVFRVVDGYDNPVNTKVVGNYIIAEDISDKFTLKLGDEYVCVERIPSK